MVLASSALLALLDALKAFAKHAGLSLNNTLRTCPITPYPTHAPRAVKAVLVLLDALKHQSHVLVRLGRASLSEGTSHEPGTLSRPDIAGGVIHARRLCRKFSRGS